MKNRRALISLGAVLTGALALTRLARGWFPVLVAGESMSPALSPGDWLAVRHLHENEPRPGQIVVVRHDGAEMVKRVVRVLDGDELWVEGDNVEASTDSRAFGTVPREAIGGVVRARYKPLRKARRFD